MLFCCQPVAQLAANLNRPEGVLSLSLGTLLLATVGNAMMVPRATITRDPVWMAGSLWGSLVMGLGNLASLALAHARFGCGPTCACACARAHLRLPPCGLHAPAPAPAPGLARTCPCNQPVGAPPVNPTNPPRAHGMHARCMCGYCLVCF
jgi:hypothetical protein